MALIETLLVSLRAAHSEKPAKHGIASNKAAEAELPVSTGRQHLLPSWMLLYNRYIRDTHLDRLQTHAPAVKQVV